ncbi:MAG: histidine kinase dimerization/phospho-acceptor domain-containing protein, partial [Thermodesulfobacteriota bacterium]|nr:histidine kinase dimerization/phospho-acceptor domain-containing protein [Thermodesulfobacteriota bacterium]
MTKTVGLRTEILITLTLLLGAALLLGGIMMLHLMEKNLLEERVGQLNSLSRVLVHALAIQYFDSDQILRQPVDSRLLKQLPQQVNCDAWWFYDRNLNLIESYTVGQSVPFSASRRQLAKLTGEPQQKVEFTALLNFFNKSDSSVHLIVPIKPENRFSGLIELHFSLADIRIRLLQSRQVLLIYIFLYGAILVLSGYYLLQRNIITPARNLLKATEDVSRGSLETRLPTAGPTEIAQLAVAYNHMVNALQVSRGETEQNILFLEETNRQLQQTQAELIRSEKMASVGQLAAGLAHELGNPLSALIGYLELLKQRMESTVDQDIVKRSLVETNRIDFLVRELLDFARPTESIQVDSVNLAVALSSAIQLLKNQGAMTDLKIINRLPDELSFIRIDRNKLQQVFI